MREHLGSPDSDVRSGKASLLLDPVKGNVRLRGLLGAELVEFLRHPLCHQPVWMEVLDDRAIGFADFLVRRVAAYAKDLVRIFLIRNRVRNVSVFNAHAVLRRKPEFTRDSADEVPFSAMVGAVGSGNLNKTGKNLFKHDQIVANDGRDLSGVGFKTGRVCLGGIEDRANLPSSLVRERHNAFEGIDFIARHPTIDLAELRCKRDERHRECRLDINIRAAPRPSAIPSRLRDIRWRSAFVHEVPERQPGNGTEWPANCKTGGAAKDLSECGQVARSLFLSARRIFPAVVAEFRNGIVYVLH